MNDAQKLADLLVNWSVGDINDNMLLSELIPIVMELETRVAALERDNRVG